ncbi:MAG TPA: class III extradiol dioxygenase subunit B-like domain-containing protein [Candidatus Limnocylindria bacterium]|nr:class III extradiol dioxygenase subunit B-like domain-containing protein [Candidatus Limnocylindria bacterium]
MAILGTALVPHPPLIVPQVGRGGEEVIRETTAAFRQASEFIAGLKPDTVVIVSPHSAMYRDWLHISPGEGAAGSLARFGAPGVRFAVRYDAELVGETEKLCVERGIPAGSQGERDPALDHGTLVPLYFLHESCPGGWPFRFVRVGLSGLPFETHWRLGTALRDAAERLGRRVAIIASGDLSHYLREDGPYGLRPEGSAYDARVMGILSRGALGELKDMHEDFCDKAGECGHRSLLVMAGALEGLDVQAKALSYEGVTGVGYGVATFLPVDAGDGGYEIQWRAYEQ